MITLCCQYKAGLLHHNTSKLCKIRNLLIVTVQSFTGFEVLLFGVVATRTSTAEVIYRRTMSRLGTLAYLDAASIQSDVLRTILQPMPSLLHWQQAVRGHHGNAVSDQSDIACSVANLPHLIELQGASVADSWRCASSQAGSSHLGCFGRLQIGQGCSIAQSRSSSLFQPLRPIWAPAGLSKRSFASALNSGARQRLDRFKTRHEDISKQLSGIATLCHSHVYLFPLTRMSTRYCGSVPPIGFTL